MKLPFVEKETVFSKREGCYPGGSSALAQFLVETLLARV